MKTTASAGRQIGGISLSPEWIEQPELATPWIRQVKEMGYVAMLIFIRHQKRTVLDQRVRDAVAAVVKTAHRCGLQAILDTDHCWWGPTFVESHPESALWAFRPVEATVQDGRFEFLVAAPRMPGQVRFQELGAVFQPDRGDYRYVSPANIQVETGCVMAPQAGVLVKGQMPRRVSGKFVFYVAFKTCAVVDVAHPAYLRGQEDLLDAYAGIPLDGFGWDEPGKGLDDLSCFKAGAGFLSFFKRRNGYDLRSKLIYLDHLDGTAKAVKIRCQYYGTLNEMNFVAQRRHNTYAKQRFGSDLIFGTHQTWSGYPADLTAGVSDYFNLGKVLSAAWTDGGWDGTEIKYHIHNFLLAEGLKIELGKRDAYYNDWGMEMPGVENMRFANRLKMLFHVNWFNHCVSDYSEDLLNFAVEPLKSMARQDVASLDRFDAMVTDQFVPHTDVAFLYNWETLAATPKWLTRAFYTFTANASIHLVDRGLYGRLMSGNSILKARLGKGFFSIGALRYKVLLVPYAGVLPEPVYRKIMAIADAGVAVVVIGPPPEFTTDGKRVADDFARRAGLQPLPLAAYASLLAEKTARPGVNEWEPSWMDCSFPVPLAGAKPVIDNEGHLLYTKSPARPLYYMPRPDPREDLANLVASLVSAPAEAFAEDTYYRFFTDPRNSQRLVILTVAKAHAASFAMAPDRYGLNVRPPIRPHQIKALFRVGGNALTVKGGTWCAVRLEDGRPVEVIGDSRDVRWNDQPAR